MTTTPALPSLTPKQIARQAVEALRDGRLPARRWDQIEEALAVQNWQRAEDILLVHRQGEVALLDQTALPNPLRPGDK